MPLAIHPVQGPIQARVTIPGSRTITHRAILLAALADGVSEITGMQMGANTQTLIKALHQLGIVVQVDKKSHSCIIAGGDGQFPKKQATLWCGNAKAITQFLIAACAPTAGVYYFDGNTRLHTLSIAPLLNILSRQGAQIIPNKTRQLPFTLVGSDSLEGGDIMLDGPTYSQLISALLMIAPFARSPFNFNHIEPYSQPAIDLTCDMMAEFGVQVHRRHHGQFTIPVPQRYQAHDYMIEPDLSVAAYFFAAAALTQGDVTTQPFKRFSAKQKDIFVLSILEKMGCRLFETHTGFSLKGPEVLEGTEFNIEDCPNSFLCIAALAPFAHSPVTLHGINKAGQVTIKRLHLFKTILTAMNVNVEAGDDYLTIFPGAPKGGLIDTQNDAHIAMATALIGLKCRGIVLDDTQCVTKRYADFFNQWNTLSEASHAHV